MKYTKYAKTPQAFLRVLSNAKWRQINQGTVVARITVKNPEVVVKPKVKS